MRKLRLEIDALNVESFETDRGRGPKPGTVRGNIYSGYEIETPCCPTGGLQYTCAGQNTCANTCAASCNGSCNDWTCGTCICPSHHYTECNCGPGTYDLSCTCV